MTKKILLEVGERAPDIELYDTDKKPVKISDLRGKRAVLAFFPGTFTGVCTKGNVRFSGQVIKF